MWSIRNLISIHAPHTRSDRSTVREVSMPSIFQSTPLIRGATHSQLIILLLSLIFQSTPLIRGATPLDDFRTSMHNFNPRPSYEERQDKYCVIHPLMYISIHAPHTRSDAGRSFLVIGRNHISIHAPHTRSDP